MSQKFSLYADLKVWENIRLFGGIYGLSRKQLSRRTEELLHTLGMESERNTPVNALPLGWKQKLAFSVAVIHEPKIVFLDEPTGGVDPVARRQFWELIYRASEQGITAFVTTHYMDGRRTHRGPRQTPGPEIGPPGRKHERSLPRPCPPGGEGRVNNKQRIAMP